INGYLDWEARVGMRGEEIAALRQAYVTSGWQGYWRKRLEMAQAQAKRKPVQPSILAWLYTRLGEKDRAFEWLQKAYEERDMSLIELYMDPSWEILRPDPRFAELLRRIGLARSVGACHAAHDKNDFPFAFRAARRIPIAFGPIPCSAFRSSSRAFVSWSRLVYPVASSACRAGRATPGGNDTLTADSNL